MKKTFMLVKKFSLLALGSLLIAWCFFVYQDSDKPVSSPAKAYRVVIDAGHGGIDQGASGVITGVSESEINLAIAKHLSKQFSENGFEVVMTRSTSAGLYGNLSSGFKNRDMQKRAEIIASAYPTVVISIHQNTFSQSSRRGAQVFYKRGDGEGERLSKSIQARLNGIKSAGRKCFVLSGDFFIINVSPCPAVIVECGFLSNEQDEKLLLSEQYQVEVADAIYFGTVDFLSVS